MQYTLRSLASYRYISPPNIAQSSNLIDGTCPCYPTFRIVQTGNPFHFSGKTLILLVLLKQVTEFPYSVYLWSDPFCCSTSNRLDWVRVKNKRIDGNLCMKMIYHVDEMLTSCPFQMRTCGKFAADNFFEGRCMREILSGLIPRDMPIKKVMCKQIGN